MRSKGSAWLNKYVQPQHWNGLHFKCECQIRCWRQPDTVLADTVNRNLNFLDRLVWLPVRRWSNATRTERISLQKKQRPSHIVNYHSWMNRYDIILLMTTYYKPEWTGCERWRNWKRCRTCEWRRPMRRNWSSVRQYPIRKGSLDSR